jgi:hypothetical protein
VQLAQLLDLSVSELPNYLLAMRLADEIAGTASDAGSHARAFREGEAVLARLVAESAPAMSRAAATRVARDALSAMVGSAVLGLDPEPEAAVRERHRHRLPWTEHKVRKDHQALRGERPALPSHVAGIAN